MWYDGSRSAWLEVSRDELAEVARNVLARAGHCPVWLFYGEMGSGKTTFIKTLCAEMGVEETMSSPTFSIIHEYRTTEEKIIYHFDFYRIKNEAEAYDIGSEEYFYSGDRCLVEWPEKVPSLLPAEFAKISITVEDPNHRTIALSVHDGKEEKRI